VPLTDSEAWFSARRLVARDPHDALPQVVHLSASTSACCASGRCGATCSQRGRRRHFVVEIDNDASALLRFGDDEHGERPNAGTAFSATYRVGNGSAGNVGADAIAHIVSASAVFAAFATRCRRPEASSPRTSSGPARRARGVPHPGARRHRGRLRRCRRAAQRRAARGRDLPLDRQLAHGLRQRRSLRRRAVDAAFEARLRRHLERFRMAGYDLEVDAPRHVALDIALHICVLRDHFALPVLRAVALELGNGVLADGRLAAFHPDRFSFGDAVYLSRIVARRRPFAGVEAVWVLKFERLGAPDPAAIGNGVIPIGRLEIARLDNDPNFQERGRLVLTGGGGK
jgi:hypothetical protein